MKRFLCFFAAFLALWLVGAQSASLRLGVLNGPSGIPCAYLIENQKKLAVQNMEFELCASAQTELPKLLKGEIDIGFLPPNAAAKVFNAGNGAVVVLGIAGNGNLYLITSDETYGTLDDLKGKKVVCAGQGATPEYMFTYLLGKKGIGIGEGADTVALDFSIPNANIAAAVISGQEKYALVPEPFATVATLKSENVLRAENIQTVFATVEENASATFPMTLLVANAQFAKENRALIKKFIDVYKTASTWTVKNPAKAGALVEKHGLGLKAPVATAAIPNAAYTWRDATSARGDIEKLLQIFLESAPESVGGKLPSDDFYFKK